MLGQPLRLLVTAVAVAIIGYVWHGAATRIGTMDRQRTAAELKERESRQWESRGQLGVFHDFRFTDTLTESGITFVNRTIHSSYYYHGSGVAVADVDNDGLTDIYFASQLGGNQLWRNMGSGKFESITDAAGVGLSGKASIGASFADTYNDGDQDLYVTTVRGGGILSSKISVTEPSGTSLGVRWPTTLAIHPGRYFSITITMGYWIFS